MKSLPEVECIPHHPAPVAVYFNILAHRTSRGGWGGENILFYKKNEASSVPPTG